MYANSRNDSTARWSPDPESFSGLRKCKSHCAPEHHSCGRRYSRRFLRSPTGRQLVYAPWTPARTTEARPDPLSCAERIPKLHIHCSPSNPLCACTLLVLTGRR